MKFQLFALLLMVAGAFALPQDSDVVVVDSLNEPAPRIIVENQIRRIIQEIRNGIRNAGLDPLEIENEEWNIAPISLPIEISAFIEDLRFSGASDIRIHSLNYNLMLNRLRFDISLPLLALSVGNSGIEGSIYDHDVEGQFKGSLIIRSIRLSGEVRVNIGIIGGISLRSISLNFRLGGIESDLFVSALGRDISAVVNDHLNVVIPNALEVNKALINKLLEDIVRAVFELI